MLDLLAFPEGFVASLRIQPSAETAQVNKVLGKYGSLPVDDPVRCRLEAWVEVLHDRTRNRSDLSIRNILGFYYNVCLPGLGLDLSHWPEDVVGHITIHLATNTDALQSIVSDDRVKAGRLQFLLSDILGATAEVPQPRKRRLEPDDDDDGHDIHRISAEDPETLHKEAKKHARDELWFMLMLTTGLRVGGFSKILTRNVCDTKGGKYVVRSEGRTKEKGNKFASFVLCPSVRELVNVWLVRWRPADTGPYLFPGARQGSPISTDAIRTSFQRLCQRCGLEGPQFHPHALRHTNAHMLLECGNSVEAVSKCLNHSSTAVTEKFYLRESAMEVQSRCNIPWVQMETENEKKKRALDALPDFLKPSNSAGSKTEDIVTDERKRRRRERRSILQDFNVGAQSQRSHG
jgi:integrase